MSALTDELQTLELRQLAVKQIMADSDNHASQAIKLGKNFEENYPEEYEAYTTARAEYHTNADRIEELKELIKQEEEQPRPEPVVEQPATTSRRSNK